MRDEGRSKKLRRRERREAQRASQPAVSSASDLSAEPTASVTTPPSEDSSKEGSATPTAPEEQAAPATETDASESAPAGMESASPDQDSPRASSDDEGTPLDDSQPEVATSAPGSDAPTMAAEPPAPAPDVPSEPMSPSEPGEVDSAEAIDPDDVDDESVEPPVVPAPAAPRVTRPLPRVLAIANQKGGVGKTTTTINLSAALAELGYRVLVVDLDPQGNATTGLGIDARHFELSMYDVLIREADLNDCIEATSVKNLFCAPATIDLAGVEIELVPAFSRELKLKRAIDGVVEDFDFILIDCPPSLGLITINGLAAATEVLVPIQCEYYALEGLGQLLRNVKLVSSNLNPELVVSTIVLTMYDARTKLAADVANEVREHFPTEVCRSVIPRTVRLSEAPSFGQPITVFDPTSRGAIAYRDLAKEVSNGATKRTR